MPRCSVCPAEANFDENLCSHCAIELTCRIMAAEPDPEYRICRNCKGSIGYTEARVLRNAKNPKTGSTVTPFLCWVCAHLYVQAHQPEKTS